MYAVFQSGGKQHRVGEGQVLRLEKLNVEAGKTVSFDRVLLVNDRDTTKVGAPWIAGSKVMAEVLQHGRGDKVGLVKLHRRKHSRKQKVHRQSFTEVKISKIII